MAGALSSLERKRAGCVGRTLCVWWQPGNQLGIDPTWPGAAFFQSLYQELPLAASPDSHGLHGGGLSGTSSTSTMLS